MYQKKCGALQSPAFRDIYYFVRRLQIRFLLLMHPFCRARCDKVVPGLGTTSLLLLLLLPVSEFWSFYNEFSKLYPIFKIIPSFQNHTQFSKSSPIFKIISNFQNHAQFSISYPIFKIIPNFQNHTHFSKLYPIFKILPKFLKKNLSCHFIFLYLSTQIVATGLRTIQFLFLYAVQYNLLIVRFSSAYLGRSIVPNTRKVRNMKEKSVWIFGLRHLWRVRAPLEGAYTTSYTSSVRKLP
jgi:hypothetical protein